MTQALSNRQRRWLKPRVHHLKPVVTIGQAGLTEAVLDEIGLALDHHELIKVKIHADDRDLRDALIAEMLSRTGAALIDRIGNIAAVFRASPEKPHRIVLPAE